MVMSAIITIILLICGYLALIQAVNAMSRQSYYGSANVILIDVVLAVMYLLICGAVGLLYVYTGYDIFTIYAALALGVLVILILFLRFCWINRSGLRKVSVIVFLLYFGIVLYLTVFMRIGTVVDTSVVTTPFDDLRNAIRTGDPALVKHMAMNVALFLPFGYLIPAMHPEKLKKCSFAFLGGMMCSTVIEGVQMVFYLGQSDIDDIIANTLGAVLGYLAVRFVWQVQKNWKV